MILNLKFTERDAAQANLDWTCNCGPAALAAIVGKTLDEIRPVFDAIGFPAKRYTNPTMMAAALAMIGVAYRVNKIEGRNSATPFFDLPKCGLARIQWEGPWTAPGANPKWAYRQTHWIAVLTPKTRDTNQAILNALDPYVFDVNAGTILFSDWERQIVPVLTSQIPRADGGWHVANSWEIVRFAMISARVSAVR